MRTALNETVTPEYVQKVWHKVTDITTSKHCESSSETIANLMNILEDLKATNDNSSAGAQTEWTDSFEFSGKDLILYALGVGASVKNPSELKFLYENHIDFSPVPSYFVMPGLLLSMGSSMVKSAITHTEFNLAQVRTKTTFFYIRICRNNANIFRFCTVNSIWR